VSFSPLRFASFPFLPSRPSSSSMSRPSGGTLIFEAVKVDTRQAQRSGDEAEQRGVGGKRPDGDEWGNIGAAPVPQHDAFPLDAQSPCPLGAVRRAGAGRRRSTSVSSVAVLTQITPSVFEPLQEV
jgi:hypothetical protein